MTGLENVPAAFSNAAAGWQGNLEHQDMHGGTRCLSLTTITITFVGSDYKAPYRNYGEPTEMTTLVVKGGEPNPAL